MSGLKIIPKSDRLQWGSMPAVPYFIMLVAWAVIGRAQKRFKSSWPHGQELFYDKEFGVWFSYMSEVEKSGMKAAKKFYHHPKRLRLLKKEYAACLKVIQEARKFVHQYSLRKFSYDELLDLYRTFVDVYERLWTVTIQSEITGYGLNGFFTREIPKHFPPDQVAEVLSILSTSDDLSFYQKEEIDFYSILKSLKPSSSVLKNDKNFRNWLKKKHPQVNYKLQQHAKEYSWLMNNYKRGQPLPESYFYSRARHVLSENKHLDEEIRAIKKQFRLSLNKKRALIKKVQAGLLKFYAQKVIGDAIAWQDDRKGWQMRAQEVIYRFLQEFSRRKKVSLDKWYYLTPKETWAVLVGALRFPHRDVKARQKRMLVVVDYNDYRIFTGRVAEKFYRIYRTNYKSDKDREVKGIVGSRGQPGILRAKVQILHSPSQVKTFKKGRVLVAELTSPDYIGAIRKASAIVTDHGGLTSHAAVVAREFNIPCIVGTKNATQAFSSGDLIEIDSNTGVVRRVKK